MSDFKLLRKMYKYGFDSKKNIVYAIVFIVMGIFFMCVDANIVPLGGMFFMLAPLYVVQTLQSINITSLVLASKKRKQLCSDMVSRFVYISMYIAYFVAIGASYIIANLRGYFNMNIFKLNIIIISFEAFTLLLYYVFCYKTFVLGVVIYGGMFITLMRNMDKISIPLDYSLPVYIVLGALIIALADILYYIINKLMYKLPNSRLALGARLRSKL